LLHLLLHLLLRSCHARLQLRAEAGAGSLGVGCQLL